MAGMFLFSGRATQRSVVGLALLLVTFANVRGFNRWEFGAHGTWSTVKVTDRLKNVYQNGFGGGVDVGMVMSEYFTLSLSVEYISLPADLDEYRNVFERSVFPPTSALVQGGHIGTLCFSFGTRLKLINEPVAPFLSSAAGVGYAFQSEVTGQWLTTGRNFVLGVSSNSEGGLCASIGCGIDVDVLPLKFALEALYRSIFVEGEGITGTIVQLGVRL